MIVEQINSTGTVLYLHHDQQGSTRLMTGGASEAGSQSFTYDPYGGTHRPHWLRDQPARLRRPIHQHRYGADLHASAYDALRRAAAAIRSRRSAAGRLALHLPARL